MIYIEISRDKNYFLQNLEMRRKFLWVRGCGAWKRQKFFYFWRSRGELERIIGYNSKKQIKNREKVIFLIKTNISYTLIRKINLMSENTYEFAKVIHISKKNSQKELPINQLVTMVEPQ